MSARGLRGWKPAALGAVAVALALAVALSLGGQGPHGAVIPQPGERDVTSWTPAGAKPLSDRRSAALVSRAPETRTDNRAANDYVPSDRQLAEFHGQAREASHGNYNPLTADVTGRPGIAHPSTDDLIQWVSHKWGIPTGWIRAQMEVESSWRQGALGDRAAVATSTLARYPRFSRVPGQGAAYESVGIAQVKWAPDGTVGAGTEPLRWESTAFDLDYYAATVRYYYDGYCGWCSRGYRAGERWNSIGAWFAPQPWANGDARGYVRAVRAALAGRRWSSPGF